MFVFSSNCSCYGHKPTSFEDSFIVNEKNVAMFINWPTWLHIKENVVAHWISVFRILSFRKKRWPYFYGSNKFLWYYTWSLLHNVVTWLSWVLDAVSHLLLCFLYKLNLPMLADWTVVQLLCQTVCGPKPSLIRSTRSPPSLHPIFTSIGCNFLVPANYCTSSPYSVAALCTYFPTLHPELYICTSDSAQLSFHSVKWFP
jgi:hypothetical protein